MTLKKERPPTAEEAAEIEAADARRQERAHNESTEIVALRRRITSEVRAEMAAEIERRADEKARAVIEAAQGKKNVAPEPHSLEAERALLGAVLLSEQWNDSVLPMVRPIVTASDFHQPAHGLLWESMLSIADRKGDSGERTVIETAVLAEELRKRDRLNAVGGIAYFGELCDHATTTALAEQHARIVADCAQRRRAQKAARQAFERATKGGEGWAGDVTAIIAKATETREDKPVTTLRTTVPEVVSAIEERRRNPDRSRGLSTSLRSLDAVIPGGLRAGQLIVVAAGPGCGKSSLYRQMLATGAASGRGDALSFSLEMDQHEQTEALLCSASGVDSGRVAEGRISDDEMRSLIEAAEGIESLPIVFDARTRLRADDIRARVLAHAARRPLSIVGVDYLQLLQLDGDAETEASALGAITRELKVLAGEARVPIVLLSQLNRSNAKDKRAPRLSDLRGSGAIEQDADKVIFLYSESDPTAPVAEVDAIIAKQRKGPQPTVRLQFVRAITLFRDLDDAGGDSHRASQDGVRW